MNQKRWSLDSFHSFKSNGEKINGQKPFISKSLALLWVLLEEHCRNSIPVCPIWKRTHFVLLLNTFFFKRKVSKTYFYRWIKQKRNEVLNICFYSAEFHSISISVWMRFWIKSEQVETKNFSIFQRSVLNSQSQRNMKLNFHLLTIFDTSMHGYKRKRRIRYMISRNESF